MVTVELIKDEVIKQNELIIGMIGRAKALFENEGDLKYLEMIQFLEQVIDQNKEDLERVESGNADTNELQSLYNAFLSRR